MQTIYKFRRQYARGLNTFVLPPGPRGPVIGISSPQRTIDPSTSQVPGGFLWWYLDLVDERGDGLVLIWSQNLPFLPSVSYGLRHGERPIPADHPSLNVVVHQRGRPAFYALQQHAPGDWAWDPDAQTWQIGRTRLQVEDHPDGRMTLTGTLDCPIPASTERLTGVIRVAGHRRLPGDTIDHRSSHLWCPLMTATTGEASLSWGSGDADLQGRAYFDRNESTTPLGELGIHQWWWGRLPLPGRELIWYRLDPLGGGPRRDIVLEVRQDGSSRLTRAPDITLGGHRWGRYGLRYPRHVAFSDPDGVRVEADVAHLVEDGPFYQRFVVTAAVKGERSTGVSELVCPGRIALPGMRPLIDMRVHQVHGPNSMWLPLFSGGRGGRVGRLFAPGRGTPALPDRTRSR